MRFNAANTQPEHDSVVTFRRRFPPQIEALFVPLLVLAREMKCPEIGTVSNPKTQGDAQFANLNAIAGFRLRPKLPAVAQCSGSGPRPPGDQVSLARLNAADTRLSANSAAWRWTRYCGSNTVCC